MGRLPSGKHRRQVYLDDDIWEQLDQIAINEDRWSTRTKADGSRYPDYDYVVNRLLRGIFPLKKNFASHKITT